VGMCIRNVILKKGSRHSRRTSKRRDALQAYHKTSKNASLSYDLGESRKEKRGTSCNGGTWEPRPKDNARNMGKSDGGALRCLDDSRGPFNQAAMGPLPSGVGKGVVEAKGSQLRFAKKMGQGGDSWGGDRTVGKFRLKKSIRSH